MDFLCAQVSLLLGGFLLENLRRVYGVLYQFCFIYDGLPDSWNLINTLLINGFPLYITHFSLFVRFSFFAFGFFVWKLKKGICLLDQFWWRFIWFLESTINALVVTWFPPPAHTHRHKKINSKGLHVCNFVSFRHGN